MRIHFEHKIGLIYLIVGSLWIYLSDSFFGNLITDTEILTQFNIIKGGLFVFVTSFLLVLLLRKHMNKIRKAEQENHEKNEEIEKQNKAYQRINKELVSAKQKAEESDRLKTAFLRNMSHEIRTPMNAIIGFSSLLSEENNNPEVIKGYAEIITKRSDDLLEIIDNITEIARIESGDKIVNKENIQASYLCNEVAQIFEEYKQKYNNYKVSCEFQNKAYIEDKVIYTDKVMILQIFRYLIDNACKYTDAGKIEIGCKQHEGKSLFFVSDTGIGIPHEFKDVIFNRFQQIEHDDAHLNSGTGLGLSIAKGLVDLLGGEMWFESQPDIGSVFYFTV
ncbi:MAG: HAMP domain-containing sensor histidine kinase [Bacteroidales bacterium]|jgi:signal transduction histidine kinase|nr:HAMP domain-containing sensor histidine kinase [Bacteroidales bacterium]